MLINNLRDCEEFVAGDGTLLRELLHPAKQAVALRYSFAHAILPPGKTSTPHSLSTSETYYILSGRGEMTINGETEPIEAGDLIYIPPKARQFAHNPGAEPLVFICIVDPAWRIQDETIYDEAGVDGASAAS